MWREHDRPADSPPQDDDASDHPLPDTDVYDVTGLLQLLDGTDV